MRLTLVPKPYRWIVALTVALTVWGLTDVRRRGRLHPDNPQRHRTDLTVYTEAGAAFFDGRAPYEVCNPRGWRYLYPPMFALALAPLHALPTEDQVTAWFFICLLLLWGCYRETRLILQELREEDDRLSARSARWFPWLGLTALTAGLFPALNCLQRGQVGVLKLYLMLLGLRLILGGRSPRAWIGGGIVLAMPIVLKIIPALPVAFMLLMLLASALRTAKVPGRPSPATAKRKLAGSALGVTLGLVLFFLLVPAVLIGWKANLRHLGTWSEIVFARRDDSGVDRLAGLETYTVRNQSLGNAAYRFGNCVAYAFFDGPNDRLVEHRNPPTMAMDAPIARKLILGLRLVLLLGLAAAGLRLSRDGDKLGQALGFALACVAMLVVSPISRGHYFMFLVPAALLLPLWLDRRGMPRAGVAMAVVPAVLSVTHYALLYQAGRIGLLGLGTTCWLVAALVLVAVAGNQPVARLQLGAAER